MMVTFICECEKKALNRTRRVLDAFANRIGSRTWQTVITEEGLQAVKKLLRKSATKNTAVACHWIRSRSRSELVWIVGNRSKFNREGIVPVNLTSESKDVEETFNMNTEVIALLASLAGFFHDIGKAMLLFQNKLDPEYHGKGYEPFRHEWVSLRLFQAFVNSRSDREWLKELEKIDNDVENRILSNLEQLKDGLCKNIKNPFEGLEPIAKIVAWLIVSHHRLPQFPKYQDTPPSLSQIKEWLALLEPCWNSPQCLKQDWDEKALTDNWIFPYGTPFKSAHWQTEISLLAERVLKNEYLFTEDWFTQRFTAHLSRLSLMLSDHYYSSQQEVTKKWQDRNYKAYANTGIDDETGNKYRKQKLDEHNIAVGTHARRIARKLPKLKQDLPSLTSNKAFSKPVDKDFQLDYGWQNSAFKTAQGLCEESQKLGFFGINMASTGKGKTRANARIMYALSEEGQCRFNVALGLRTLTLQTGDALRKHMNLSYAELAVLIGSQAVKDLHQLGSQIKHSVQEQQGSESAESLLKDELELHHELPEYDGEFAEWFEHDEKILKLIQAPVLVSTIDYLIPATDGLRGGRQIAPMLRLLSSDLVIDEPDDFGLEDLPALCRLVNWAGMLGAKVLLSTATLSPELAFALFEAYQKGRKHYTQVNGELGQTEAVCCAWFDEFKKPMQQKIDTKNGFNDAHKEFIRERIENLGKSAKPLNKTKINSIEITNKNAQPSRIYAQNIQAALVDLHQKNSVEHPSGKKISIGLVRMANIDPLVAIAKHLYAIQPANDSRIYYCVYHSQYPLALRSQIEEKLDKALTRHDEDKWWQASGIETLIKESDVQNHIFVVLATSVAEVGRDHDYDWAVVEPSSMRSIIQLAGRVQRHRKKSPTFENIVLLDKNFKGLRGLSPCFLRPGYESSKRQFAGTKLSELLTEEEYQPISAIPRIKNSSPPFSLTDDKPPKFKRFNELEHIVQHIRLFGNNNEQDCAYLWWRHDVTWCGEIQRIQPFRKSEPMEDYNLNQSYHQEMIWQKKNTEIRPAKFETTNDICRLKAEHLTVASGNQAWFDLTIENSIAYLMKELKISEDEAYKRFTTVQLRKPKEGEATNWRFHEKLGVFKELLKDRLNDD
ncbi:type I-F CRISPR-associated helicase Cas3f [Methylotuvimicrobium sp. KM1]|uniref:type I-F CRISPR-associated helicase Cas3f n=1 Tax=Methylotuvimicrobium sp. KM1 TaxID=3377707 RepID=UPI00384EF365